MKTNNSKMIVVTRWCMQQPIFFTAGISRGKSVQPKGRFVGMEPNCPTNNSHHSAAVQAVLEDWLVPLLVKRFLDSSETSGTAIQGIASARSK